MAESCDTSRFALRATELGRLAQQLGYEHLARWLIRHPGGVAPRRFARELATAAARAFHAPHTTGPCRRAGRLGAHGVLLLTVPNGRHHVIRSARRIDITAEEGEALFDAVIG